MLRRTIARVSWAVLSVLAALALAVLTTSGNKPVNSLWLITAAASIFLLGFRFYGRFIAVRVMQLDDRRATPAERF